MGREDISRRTIKLSNKNHNQTPRKRQGRNEAVEQIYQILANATSTEISVVKAECGLSKSYSATDFSTKVIENNKKTQIHIHGPTQNLLKQYEAIFEAAGVSCIRVKSRLPSCPRRQEIEPLINAGMTMQDFCCDCDHICANAGRINLDGYQVILMTHALMGKIQSGNPKYTFIDEPPPLIKLFKFSWDELEDALRCIKFFDGKYNFKIESIIKALLKKQKFRGQTELTTPRLNFWKAGQLSPDRSKRFGTSLEVYRAIVNAYWPPKDLYCYRAIFKNCIPIGCSKIDIVDDGVVIQYPNYPYLNILEKDTITILLDATFDENKYKSIDGSEWLTSKPIKVFKIEAEDGAHVDRALINCAKASRNFWCKDGQVFARPSLARAFEMMIDILEKRHPDAKKIGIITYKPIEDAFNCEQPNTIQLEFRNIMQPILDKWKGEIIWDHYHGIRGLNKFENVDGLFTLGDPWPVMDDVKLECFFRGKHLKTDINKEMVLQTQSELEQARGRLRTIWRDTPSFYYHIGNQQYLPQTGKMVDCEIIFMPTGRPKKEIVMSPEEIKWRVKKHGGQVKVAMLIGCTQPYLSKCINGKIPISNEMATKLRNLDDDISGGDE